MTTTTSQAPRRRVTRAELADILGVAKTTVDAWVSRGAPFVERGAGKGSRWAFDVAAVVEWRIEEKAKEVARRFEEAGAAGSREDAERRRAVALATLAEIELDERLGRVVLVSDAAEASASFVQVIRTGLANAAFKIAGRAASMGNPAQIQLMVEDELNRAFRAARAEYERKWADVMPKSSEAQPPAQG